MTDDTQLPELTRRQEEILALIIRSYTNKPEPVSSKFLKESYSLGYSAATIRNEMMVLDELGLINAPHTSAGRVPSAVGYRYFVKRLLESNALLPSEQAYIAERFQSLPLAMEHWLKGAARQLTRTVQIASLVTPPVAAISRFKHLELIAIQGRLCLMVLVLQGGSVHQQMINLAEPVSQETLSETASQINRIGGNLTAGDLRVRSVQLAVLPRDLSELAAEMMERADTNRVRTVYRDGLSEVVGSFPVHEGDQQVLRVFEENAILNMIISEFVEPLESSEVKVVIAGEGRWEELSHLTMILSRYGIPDHASGALGVLGPTNLDYARAISTVRYIADLLTSMLEDLYQIDEMDDKPPLPPETPPNTP